MHCRGQPSRYRLTSAVKGDGVMVKVYPSEVRSRWFEVEHVEEVAVLKFIHPNLGDEETARVVGRQLLALLENQGQARFVLDLAEVRRVSSALLGNLIAFNRKVKQAGGE